MNGATCDICGKPFWGESLGDRVCSSCRSSALSRSKRYTNNTKLLLEIISAYKKIGGCLCGHGESCGVCSMDYRLSMAIKRAINKIDL